MYIVGCFPRLPQNTGQKITCGSWRRLAYQRHTPLYMTARLSARGSLVVGEVG